MAVLYFLSSEVVNWELGVKLKYVFSRVIFKLEIVVGRVSTLYLPRRKPNLRDSFYHFFFSLFINSFKVLSFYLSNFNNGVFLLKCKWMKNTLHENLEEFLREISI